MQILFCTRVREQTSLENAYMEHPQNVKITFLLIKGKYNVPKYGMGTTGSEYSRKIGRVIKDKDFATKFIVRQLVGVSALRYDTVIHVSISSREM